MDKRITYALICVLLILAVVFDSSKAMATSYLNIPYWDCVDSGKHLDYDGDSIYISYVSAGAGKWNNYKSGVIRYDTIFTVQDVYVEDVPDNYPWTGQTNSSGAMYFNTNKMNLLSDIQKTNVAAHELGHALGLRHSTQGSIMYCASSQYTTPMILSQDDKDSYDDAYNNYYN